MDKAAIKNFAIWARRKLIDDITQKAYEIGITEKEIKVSQIETSDTMIINDRTLNKIEIEQRKSLVDKVREKGFSNVVEEVAYTWFNRIIAIRFMEINEYLPTGVRVLSSVEPEKTEPDVIKEALNIDLNTDKELVYRLQDSSNTEELFRYLFVKQCNALNEILPVLFEEISDYTEILLPYNLLSEGSVIRELINSISEDDFKEQVEIIGWMYQYYISERKDSVFEGLKKNIKITKENIPAATQLFTPDWIVKYMVENSVGRVWLEGHPNEELNNKWQYYLDEEEQETQVQEHIDELRSNREKLKPEDIKILDPAMGSGHILVYAFDVLYDIYMSQGYSAKDIPSLILNNNLYGLDIDDRAAQLAYFAVMMKARSKSRRIFKEKIDLKICSIKESDGFPNEAIQYLVNSSETELEKNTHKEQIEYLIKTFNNAKDYGSLINVMDIDFDSIEKRLHEICHNITQDLFEYQYRKEIIEKVPMLIKQAKILSQKYDIVIANPPYMATKGMNGELKNYIEKNFSNEKQDIYGVFIKRNFLFLKEYGYVAMVTMQAFMFIQSFEILRKYLIAEKQIINLIQIGFNSFPSMNSKIAHACAFIIYQQNIKNYNSKFMNLNNGDETADKNYVYLDKKRKNQYYLIDTNRFNIVDGSPFAYWISNKLLNAFVSGKKLNSIAFPRQGLATGNNDFFLRYWYEVNINRIGFNCNSTEEFHKTKYLYTPYNKGGGYRKWYGNLEYVIKFDKENYELLLNQGNHLPSRQFYFKPGLTWSTLTTGAFSARITRSGTVFDTKGSSCFFKSDVEKYFILGFMNSKVCSKLLEILAPTVDFNAGSIGKLPILKFDTDKVKSLVENCIAITKVDWDLAETSWDFIKHPFLFRMIKSKSIKESIKNLTEFVNYQYSKLKKCEEELNSIIIDAYHLDDELDPNIDEKFISVNKVDALRAVKAFISYFIGCVLGRYSLDTEGLVFAGGSFNDKWRYFNGQLMVRNTANSKESEQINDMWLHTTFAPVMDNILSITDEEYFDDDIVSRFVEFVRVIFSSDTLEKNLDYIADILVRKASETSRQTIRRYLLKDFYEDHVQTYQKKPIYWLFDSGKRDGFKALIYLHRYDEFTVAKVRTDHLHKIQKSYESEVKRLDIVIDSNASEREKANARKKKEKILKQMEECMQYDQVIAHIANQRINIDLDDGVSVNYAKFQGVEIPQGEGKKPLKADLLAKI